MEAKKVFFNPSSLEKRACGGGISAKLYYVASCNSFKVKCPVSAWMNIHLATSYYMVIVNIAAVQKQNVWRVNAKDTALSWSKIEMH